MRSSLFCSFLAILTLTVAARAEDTYTIKLKHSPDVGKSITVTDTSTTTAQNKVTDADGNVVGDDKKHVEKKEEVYTETVLEKGDKRPNKYKRSYEKAIRTRDGKAEALSYEGRTIIFEKKGGKYTVTAEGEKPISKDDLEELTSTANQSSLGEEELFIPTKPVKVGDTWKMEPKKIAESFPGGLDAARTSGEVKLTKVYQKEGHPYGILDVTLKLAVPVAKGVTFEKEPMLVFKVTLDTAIDGSSTSGVLTGTGSLSSKGTVEQGGKKFTVESSLAIIGERTQSAQK